MTDGYPERAGGSDGPDRTRLLLGGAVATVLLVVIGASGGWVLAGSDDGAPPDRPVAAATTDAATPPTDEPTSSSPRTSGPAPRTTAPSSAGLTVPEVVGTDFESARERLREHKLGWRLVFGTGTGQDVTRSSPAPGTPVRKGVTVTLWVAGPAPAVDVPELTGDDCGDAADDLVEAGLYPRYATGRSGKVSAQEPAAGTAARWNDPVSISCGTGPSASPTPSATP
ncbi:PASTA domain-containing protein [Micromonospora sp. R77]|uniref:PASTA domain-containing protein n=1 Tax=Micromonospora sp. R77 TaxID=2925836 RepID=UPI001F617D86|nr:PASTA domain-containing protein [Micromonospora sp. R77]MCI4063489.1 PASTA domain-containing protein [Micromonospora sp. R77]